MSDYYPTSQRGKVFSNQQVMVFIGIGLGIAIGGAVGEAWGWRAAFLVVGPMIDLKLFGMQAATFGRGFALRFAPVTFAVATGTAVLTGAVLL